MNSSSYTFTSHHLSQTKMLTVPVTDQHLIIIGHILFCHNILSSCLLGYLSYLTSKVFLPLYSPSHFLSLSVTFLSFIHLYLSLLVALFPICFSTFWVHPHSIIFLHVLLCKPYGIYITQTMIPEFQKFLDPLQ